MLNILRMSLILGWTDFYRNWKVHR